MPRCRSCKTCPRTPLSSAPAVFASCCSLRCCRIRRRCSRTSPLATHCASFDRASAGSDPSQFFCAPMLLHETGGCDSTGAHRHAEKSSGGRAAPRRSHGLTHNRSKQGGGGCTGTTILVQRQALCTLHATPRLMMIDLLEHEVQPCLFAGLLIFNAEDVALNSGIEFTVRLFRRGNKTGFVHVLGIFCTTRNKTRVETTRRRWQ